MTKTPPSTDAKPGDRKPVEIDFSMLTRLEFLDPDGESGLLKNLIELYSDSAVESNRRLRDAAATGTPDQLSKVAHALKSGHSNLGVTSIVVILQKIEDQAFEKSELEGLMNDVEHMTVEASQQFKQYLLTR
jgi:HPt (histidine-containing phosphotransfer) domain-containing protein